MNKGRSTVPAPIPFAKVRGIICAASPNDLNRLAEIDFSTKYLSIVTKFRLQMTSPGYKPDLVLTNGDYFIVKTVEDYARYGPGWVQSIAASIDYQDQPPSPGASRAAC